MDLVRTDVGLNQGSHARGSGVSPEQRGQVCLADSDDQQ